MNANVSVEQVLAYNSTSRSRKYRDSRIWWTSSVPASSDCQEPANSSISRFWSAVESFGWLSRLVLTYFLVLRCFQRAAQPTGRFCSQRKTSAACSSGNSNSKATFIILKFQKKALFLQRRGQRAERSGRREGNNYVY